MNEFFIFNFLFLLFVSIFIFIFFTNSPFVLMVLSSLFSMILVIIYAFLKATDVAITEVTISSSISTIIFVLSILYINNHKRQKKIFHNNVFNMKFKRKFILAILIVVFGYFTSILFDFLSINFNNHYNDLNNINVLYLKKSVNDFKIPSIVTSIIVGYRALDTFFESMVILFGSIAFYNILIDRID